MGRTVDTSMCVYAHARKHGVRGIRRGKKSVSLLAAVERLLNQSEKH